MRLPLAEVKNRKKRHGKKNVSVRLPPKQKVFEKKRQEQGMDCLRINEIYGLDGKRDGCLAIKMESKEKKEAIL